ncbi:MAG: Gfo/Idh/MocA family oxidoreductase [bacterium]|nr:Gfo/Idh/MocA family oxidoreductase [bacterium]
MGKNFALIGAAGYVAPRHIKAIAETGNHLVAAADPHDAVGVLDRFALDVPYFSEIERFDRHLEKVRRGSESERVHYVTICSPNYLHDAHIRMALRAGAHAICEKPLVINPWNLDALAELERETGRSVYTVLQLRRLPVLRDLKSRLDRLAGDQRLSVSLRYITARGPWYHRSWKGSEERSGGLCLNIGIHLFDLLLWLFGSVHEATVFERSNTRAVGHLELDRASVLWQLSVNADDLPFQAVPGSKTSFRSLCIEGEEVEFTQGLTELHTEVYQATLAGKGCGIEQARPSVELVHRIRTSELARPEHPLAVDFVRQLEQ